MKLPTKGLVDTNILLLIMFAASKRDPAKDNRLARYDATDIFLIENLLANFESILTTPNVLTETNSMIKGYHEYSWLSDFIANVRENYIPSSSVVENDLFPQFGLTDLGLLDNELQDSCVITDDIKLFWLLKSVDRQAILYSDFREEQILSNH